MNSVDSEEKFIELVKKNTIETAKILNGGLYTDVTEDDEEMFPLTQVQEGEEPILAEEDKQLIEWLYSADRKKGDMKIIRCASSVKLYYFVDNVPAWQNSLRNTMTNEKYEAWYNENVADGSYSTVINHGLIDFFT